MLLRTFHVQRTHVTHMSSGFRAGEKRGRNCDCPQITLIYWQHAEEETAILHDRESVDTCVFCSIRPPFAKWQ